MTLPEASVVIPALLVPVASAPLLVPDPLDS